MAREKSIPSTSTFIQDYGLNVQPDAVNLNRSVVVIGTASDGPMYEPVFIGKPEEAEYAFGPLGAGDLVRGVYECWNAQNGTPNIYAVRIGNGKKSKLELYESNGSDANTPESGSYVAMKLEAKYPGSIYNQISINYDSDRNVSIYNPKTGITTKISADTIRVNNPNVDVHNVAQLVDYINNDRNLSSIITASYEPIPADFEVSLTSASGVFISNTDSAVTIQLKDVLSDVVDSGAWIISDPVNAKIGATNNIISLDAVEAVSISTWENLSNAGRTSSYLSMSPIDGKGATWATIRAMKDYSGTFEYINSPSGNIVSEFIYSANFVLMDGGNGEGAPTAVSGISNTNTFQIYTPLCPDDTDLPASGSVPSGIIYNDSVYSDYIGTSGTHWETVSGVNVWMSGELWKNATCYGIDNNADDLRPSGIIQVFVSDDYDVGSSWTELPYSSTSGVYLSSFNASGNLATFAIGTDLTANVSGIMRQLVDVNGKIIEGKYIRVNFKTIKGFATEVESLPALSDATPDASSPKFFTRGNEVIFDGVPAYDMIINYGTRINYEIGVNVELIDAAKGIISFTDPELLPGPGGGKIGATGSSAKSNIRFKYSYLPQWPAITTAVKSLTGGTNGNQLSVSQRYNEISNSLERLRNFEATLWVPMGAYVDAIKEGYNPNTGLKEEISAGFHLLFEDFLDDLSINSVQPHCILGVTPLTSTSQADKNESIARLTTVDPSDPTRAANIMLGIQNKFISVVSFEPIIPNTGRGSPYATNGQAVYAGMLASIPYNISPTNKEIKGVYNLRYNLSNSQYEALNAARYVTMELRPGQNPVIVNDVTAAPYGSDFTSWSVYSITAEASDRVRRVAKNYIGRPNDIPTRNSLEQEISNVLLGMAGLQAFNFTLNSTINQQVLGIVEVDLILVPIFTIKRIRTTVKLRKSIQ